MTAFQKPSTDWGEIKHSAFQNYTLANILADAAVYLVEPQISGYIYDNLPPDETPLRNSDLPSSIMAIVKGCPLADTLHVKLLTRTNEGVEVCIILQWREDDGDVYIQRDLSLASEWDTDRKDLNWIKGFLAFINSPYIPKEELKIERPLRRLHERKTGRSAPLVNVIRLRAEQSSPPNSSSPAVNAGDPKSVGWKNRWIVRGHYRNQWFGRTKDHKTIWIPPYVKGPDDKPIRPTVYKVDR